MAETELIYTASNARRYFTDLMGEVIYAKKRVIISWRGSQAAVVVPLNDYIFLKSVEKNSTTIPPATSCDCAKKEESDVEVPSCDSGGNCRL